MSIRINYYPFENVENCLLDGLAVYPVSVNETLWYSNRYNHMIVNRLGAEICYWLASNQAVAYHATHNDSTYNDKDEKEINTHHRFFFLDGDKAKQFIAALPSFTRGKYMYYTFLPNECVALSNALSYDLPQAGSKEDFDLWMWCKENLTAKVYAEADGKVLFFESDADAVLFSITHRGAGAPEA